MKLFIEMEKRVVDVKEIDRKKLYTMFNLPYRLFALTNRGKVYSVNYMDKDITEIYGNQPHGLHTIWKPREIKTKSVKKFFVYENYKEE